jgi:Plasmid pRiA4b ORF-3-like protein
MSPVSRGRKSKQNKKAATRPPEVRGVLAAPDECDCPSCSGAELDPQQLVDDLITVTADVVGSDDPLDAECVGAAFVAIGAAVGAEFEEALVGAFIPEFEARASTEALAMLLAVGSVAGGRAGKEAAVAADRMVEAGVIRPGWAAELTEPVTVGECWRLVDSAGIASMLACSFHRAGRSHTVVLSADHTDCGAADDILLLDTDDLGQTVELARAGGAQSGADVSAETLDAAEFRWQVEKALDARAVHDGALSDDEMDELLTDDDDGPGYPALAVLLRARMNALPAPGKPAAAHEGEVGWAGPAALQTLAELVSGLADPSGTGGPATARGRAVGAALPAKRRKSGRPAPTYQLKVGLRETRPPIWRRLEVPADISLARLHTVIQVAFGWDDGHMHVFETPYGSFGIADAELGHRAEAPVTLEQVAPAVNGKLRYTYDFGDDWEHDIVVEKILDGGGAAGPPRCTGGRRAAPPEDCGGVWGYDELVEILNDPDHPEHADRLEWLGLDDAADFDPGRFDAAAVTRALSNLA